MTEIRGFVRRAVDRWATERPRNSETMNEQDGQASLPLTALAPVPLVISHRTAPRILYANDAALALFEAPANAYQQLPTAQFHVRPPDRAEILRRVTRNGSLSNFETELCTLTGRRFWALVAASLSEYQGERAMVMIITDISAQKMREHQLAQATELLRVQTTDFDKLTIELRAQRREADSANRAKSDFLAQMSHELRSPLNAIMGFSEVIANQTFGSSVMDRYSAYAANIHTAGAHLLSLINDILDLAKIESGKLDVTLAKVELAPTLEICVDLAQQLAEKRDVALHLHIPDRAVVIEADRRRLQQMVLNLITNAVKFTLAGGKVTLNAVQTPDGGTIISVVDTGIGMTPDQLETALEPFGQIAPSSDDDERGTGLGLPIVKRLIEMHGGRLEIETAPNQGTTARLILPARRAANLK
jgi:two-component system cell cycle sensor histidine kinase PleC